MTNLKKVLLIYPEVGFYGNYVVDVPLSLVYASSLIAKRRDVEVEIYDCRLDSDWKTILQEKISNDKDRILLAGFTVMTGLPVKKALEASKLIKNIKNVPIVWGGPHSTILPKEVLGNVLVDYCIRGFGSEALNYLVQKMLDNNNELENYMGLCFKQKGKLSIAPINTEWEDIEVHELPYNMVEEDMDRYLQRNHQRVFPIYTSVGCPYKCAFCITPIMLKGKSEKWKPFSAQRVVDSMEYLKNRYSLTYVYLYDEESFVNLEHFRSIIAEMKKRGFRIGVGMRGVRVNELLRMTDGDLRNLESSGVKYLHVGIESGSQKMLNLMKKGITVEKSINANKRLSRYPGMIPMYNFLVGLPGETVEDLKQTKELMIRLSRDNPNCIIFEPGKFIPYPGSELYDISIQHGLTPPDNLEAWAKYDQEKDIYMPWYSKEYNNYIKMLKMASYVLSDWKGFTVNCNASIGIIYQVFKVIYKEICFLRLRYDYTGFMFEFWLDRTVRYIILKFISLGKRR